VIRASAAAKPPKSQKSPEFLIHENHLILNVEDDYQNLNRKTYELFKTIYYLYPNCIGCFKCDDDVLLNLNTLFKFNQYLEYCAKIKQEVNYVGQIVFLPPEEIYCGGPLYYLSNRALKCFQPHVFTPEHFEKIKKKTIAEDRMVGYIMEDNGICPIDHKLYDDNLKMINGYSYHNKDHKNTLYLRIQGGIGNQLFQIASGYGIAMQNDMNFVIFDTCDIKSDFTHTDDNRYILETLFKEFPNIKIKCLNVEEIPYYKEKPENSFQYSELKFQYDVLLDGYFQNEKYFNFCRSDILYKLKAKSQYYNFFKMLYQKNAEQMAQKVKNSYFIHIRRGDYVKVPHFSKLYSINYDKYFTSAIAYILDADPDAFFYIVSDDIPYCKSYHVLNNINKGFVDLGDIETLYFMSYCYKGGICSNSTFSWWGSYLNENPDKIVTFPSKWMNNDWINDIYYDGSITINC
jgi:hypothetical protein